MEALIHFEDDTEELQQWDHQVIFLRIYFLLSLFFDSIFSIFLVKKGLSFVWNIDIYIAYVVIKPLCILKNLIN